MTDKRTRPATITSGTQYFGNTFADKGRGDWETYTTKLPKSVKDRLKRLKEEYGVAGTNDVLLAAIQLLIDENPEKIDGLLARLIRE